MRSSLEGARTHSQKSRSSPYPQAWGRRPAGKARMCSARIQGTRKRILPPSYRTYGPRKTRPPGSGRASHSLVSRCSSHLRRSLPMGDQGRRILILQPPPLPPVPTVRVVRQWEWSGLIRACNCHRLTRFTNDPTRVALCFRYACLAAVRQARINSDRVKAVHRRSGLPGHRAPLPHWADYPAAAENRTVALSAALPWPATSPHAPQRDPSVAKPRHAPTLWDGPERRVPQRLGRVSAEPPAISRAASPRTVAMPEHQRLPRECRAVPAASLKRRRD